MNIGIVGNGFIAETNDLLHAIPFANPLTVCRGNYEDLAALTKSAEILKVEIEKINP
jgi:hypothetical protein